MSDKFYAILKETRVKWEPGKGRKQVLVMLTDGSLAIVEKEIFTFIRALNTKYWKTVVTENMKGMIDK